MIKIKCFEFNLFSENTYVLYDETKEAVIIDCGCMSADEEKRLSEFIAGHELAPKLLLCTHLHLDHILGNAFVHRTYGLLPKAHRLEVEQIPPLDVQMKQMGLHASVDAVPVTSFLNENEPIRFGHSELAVLFVPGHSPGWLRPLRRYAVCRKYRTNRLVGRKLREACFSDPKQNPILA